MFLRVKFSPERVGQRARRVLMALALAGLAWALVLGEGGWLHVRRLRSENARLAAEVARLRREQARAAADLEALRQPASFELEQVARERYGMHRPGERVVHVLGGDSPGTAPPSP